MTSETGLLVGIALGALSVVFSAARLYIALLDRKDRQRDQRVSEGEEKL